MARLFLASKITMSDDPRKTARSAAGAPLPAKKDGAVAAVTVPHIDEAQLSAATGGTEASCYRCVVPFGVVVLIAGVVVTAVAYTFNSHGSNISVLGLTLLAAGLGLLGSSAACWRVRLRRKEQRRRKRDERRESQAALMASHGAFVA